MEKNTITNGYCKCGAYLQDGVEQCNNCEAKVRNGKKDALKIICVALAFLPFIFFGRYNSSHNQEVTEPQVQTSASSPSPEPQAALSTPSVASSASASEVALKEAKEAIYEPIGKYPKSEVMAVSDFSGLIYNQTKKIDKINDRMFSRFKSYYRAADSYGLETTATNYSIDLLDEKNEIDKINLPDIANQKAYAKLSDAKETLSGYVELQRSRATALLQTMAQDGEGGDDLKDVFKSVNDNGVVLIARMAMDVSLAMMSYGYTVQQLDDHLRLKRNARPDRDDNNKQ